MKQQRGIDNISNEGLYWLAGLLEGEGSFLSGPPSAPTKIGIALTMTDEDVVSRVASLWGVAFHHVRREISRIRGWKPIYYVHLRGRAAADLMQRLLPLMGNRRQEQIRKALASYDPNKRRKLSPDTIAEIKAKLSEGSQHTEACEAVWRR